MGQYRDGIKAWIRAEYIFRCSSIAYTTLAQDQFVKACDDLRELVTGQREVEDATRVIKREDTKAKER